MLTKQENLSELEFNREAWRRELRFHYQEMDLFKEKLGEIARKEFGKDTRKKLEIYQNRIEIEKSAISKLKHRAKAKPLSTTEEYDDEVNTRIQNEHNALRSDMRQYIKMHYDLKEELMDYFAEYLNE
ncbi:MAG: hypothetical protein AAF466_09885 [Bacteroidota bacterium]